MDDAKMVDSNNNLRLAKSAAEGSTGRRLGRSIFAALFLALGRFFFERVAVSHLFGLAREGEVETLKRAVNNADISASLFLLLQLLLVMAYYRFMTSPELPTCGLAQRASFARRVAYGAMGGLAVAIATLPPLLSSSQRVGYIGLLVSNLYSSRSFFVAALLLFALPLTTELVFRRILFCEWLGPMRLAAAITVSSLLFAYTWPLYNPLTALVLGGVAATLYYRFGSLVPCVAANAVATLSCAVVVGYKALL